MFDDRPELEVEWFDPATVTILAGALVLVAGVAVLVRLWRRFDQWWKDTMP